MPSALIHSAGRQPAMLLAEQLAHESCVRPGPLVLGTAPLKSPTPATDRDRHICYLGPSHAARTDGQVISAWLCMSPCRSDHLFTVQRTVFGVWSLRILDEVESFLLIDRTDGFSLLRIRGTSTVGYSVFPAYSRIYRQRVMSTVSRRSKPSSRTALMGEQPNPWEMLHPQDATSRHRGAKPCRRCGLLGKISLLSPGYLLSVDRPRFHMPRPGH
jgi:hypothetical protein